MPDTPELIAFVEQKNALYKQVDMLESKANKIKGKRSLNKLLAMGIVDLTKGQMLIMDMLIEILSRENNDSNPPQFTA